MEGESALPTLKVRAVADPDGLTATIHAPDGEELLSQRSSSLHWLRVDLSNRSSPVSKMLLNMYADGYVLEVEIQRLNTWNAAGTIHVSPLPEAGKSARSAPGRTLNATSSKLLRTFPFMIAVGSQGVAKVNGLVLCGRELDLVFGFVGKSETGGSVLWTRFPELMDGGTNLPTRTIVFGERGTHVVYAVDNFSNPVDANRRAEQLARKFVEMLGKLRKGEP